MHRLELFNIIWKHFELIYLNNVKETAAPNTTNNSPKINNSHRYASANTMRPQNKQHVPTINNVWFLEIYFFNKGSNTIKRRRNEEKKRRRRQKEKKRKRTKSNTSVNL